jgi:protein-disulfide isomerase
MTTRKKRRRAAAQRRGVSTSLILAVIGAALLAVALLVVANSLMSPGTSVPDITYPSGVTAEGEPYKGSPDAPLQLVEYSDFLCGHCRDFADTVDSLSAEYIETGKLQVVFRNYAFLAPESLQAAAAAECALEQGPGKFWHYHDLLFASQGAGPAAYTGTRLQSYAREIGLDAGAFADCLQSAATAAEVEADKQAGASQGVEATPTWFLNGEMVRGALAEEDLRRLLDRKLTEASPQ